jgi:hypothetical protein
MNAVLCCPPDKGGANEMSGGFVFAETPRTPSASDPLIRGSG